MMMTQRSTLMAGAVFSGLAVAIGAFGAHGLRDILMENQRIDTFELAVKYQVYHAFALLATGILMEFFDDRRLAYAAVAFIIGIVVFSGSLYTLSLTGITKLGAITPIGGLAFIVGWLLLIFAVSRTNSRRVS